ncbi:MAG: hypothetical protein JF632_02300, partial [Acidobacteria bacterium]|nr:hypothetical protein [Acidobacteriota bacterium]
MKRSISRWTMALATAGVLVLPVSSFAGAPQQPAPQQQPSQPSQPDRPQQPPTDPQPQPTPRPTDPQPSQPQPQPTPQPTQPQPTEPQPTQQPTASAAPTSADQSVSPQEHLRQAQQAVNDIKANSVPAKDRSSLAQLKRHLSNLERLGPSAGASTTGTTASSSKSTSASSQANWGTEVAAIDKIITDIAGSDTA